MKTKNPLVVLMGWLALALGPTHNVAVHAAGGGVVGGAVQPTGTIVGRVSNAATKYFLEGAVVQLAGANRVTTTDRDGAYQFAGVTGEAAKLVVSFTGLDTEEILVAVRPGQTVVRDIELTAAIYKLEAYRVVGDREGGALAVTRQRAAPNVKNVVATDAFGAQTEDNVGSFLQRLPGLTAVFSTGSVRNVMVRGISPELNTVEMDGVQLANTDSLGQNRAFDFLQASISLLDSIEVTKAPTPDMPASSIGGSINMVTRTPFGRNAPRLFTYSVGVVHAVGRIGGRAEKGYEEPIEKITPAVNFSYSDVLGRKRNLGILMTFSRNTAFGSGTDSIFAYPATLTQPNFISSYGVRVVAVQGPHTRQNESIKLEYKLNDSTTFTLNGMHNYYLEVNDTRGLSLAAGANATNYAPGYSETYTEALPRTTATASLAETSYDLPSNNYRIQASAVHRLDGLTIDYSGTASFSSATQEYLPWSRKPKGVLAISGLNGIGYIIDRRQDEIWPTVTQTAGPDVYNLANYTTMTLAQNNRRSDSSITEARINARKNFNLAAPTFIKTGLQFQQQRRDTQFDYYSFRFTGPGGLGQFVDRRPWVNDRVNGVRQGPWADLLYVAQHKEDNRSQWDEDYYYHYSQKLLGQKDFKEEIRSGYVMGNVQLGALNILGGLRTEGTEVVGNGPIRRVAPAEQARRTAWVGPVTDAEARRRADAEFATRARAVGKYRNVFPGIHFKYAARSGLVARASYSTSIGRPLISSILPNVTVNDAAQTIAIANTKLKPQFSDNFDLNLEYYYEPVGLFSASVFLKELSSFIYTDTSQFVGAGANNGFDGLYENYRISTTANGGKARYRGFELSYQQQFTFLPGFWSGFGVNINYSFVETKGDYGGTVATTQVAGFTPRTANFAISYQKNRLKLSATANWLDDYLASVSTNAASIIHESPRTFVGAKLTYALTTRTNFYINWDNITKTPVNNRYAGYKERAQLVRSVPPLIGVGIQGRF